MRAALVPVVVVMLATACAREQPNTPEASYRAFAEALRRGDPRTAYAGLSAPTRAKAEALARTIGDASQGLIKGADGGAPDPALMLFQSGTRPAPMGDVTRVSMDEATAIVEVGLDGGRQQVKLVKDSGRWLIDLTETLDRSEDPP